MHHTGASGCGRLRVRDGGAEKHSGLRVLVLHPAALTNWGVRGFCTFGITPCALALAPCLPPSPGQSPQHSAESQWAPSLPLFLFHSQPQNNANRKDKVHTAFQAKSSPSSPPPFPFLRFLG